MIKRFSSWIIVTGLGFFWLAAGASAQQPFYKGKTVRIIVGGSAGGGYIRIQAGTPDYAFGRVLRESAAYYLLGVQPEDRDRDGRPHVIRTTVKAKGAVVRGRSHVIIPRRK